MDGIAGDAVIDDFRFKADTEFLIQYPSFVYDIFS